jgi:hypothetical protein
MADLKLDNGTIDDLHYSIANVQRCTDEKPLETMLNGTVSKELYWKYLRKNCKSTIS